MRRFLVSLLVLLGAGPAQAAPRPVVALPGANLPGAGTAWELAGETVLYTQTRGRTLRLQAVPAAGGATRTVFTHQSTRPSVQLVASAERVLITTEDGRTFSGPPSGPFAPFDDQPTGLTQYRLDGDRVITYEDIGEETARVLVDGQEIAFTSRDWSDLATFAGDLEGHPHAAPGQDPIFPQRLIVRSWRTRQQLYQADLPKWIDRIALRPDGRAAVDANGTVYDVRPGPAPRRLAGGAGATFAGERIVFRSGEGLLMVEPDGTQRRFGIPSRSIGAPSANERYVLWSANGCLLIAEVTDAAAAEPGPGACARSEVAVIGRLPREPKRTVSVRLRCVAGQDGRCRGTVRLRLQTFTGSIPVVSARKRFEIPAGSTRRVAVRLTARGHARARRDGAGSLVTQTTLR